jgi:hypothetical protein
MGHKTPQRRVGIAAGRLTALIVTGRLVEGA